MRKWRERDRMIAPSSQMLTQGGIRSRDWFSDRLQDTNSHRSQPLKLDSFAPNSI